MINEVDSMLGGRAAEEILLGDISTGASNDIARATDILKQMIVSYGMSDKFKNMTLGRGVLGNRGGEPNLVREFSEETQNYIDSEIARIMDERYKAVVKLLTDHKDLLDFIARRLEEIETMDGKEFYDIKKGEAHCKEIEEKAKAKENFEIKEWHLNNKDGEAIKDESEFKENTTIFAVSKRKVVGYKVEHLKENIENAEYTVSETEAKTGEAGKNTSAEAKQYEGFKCQGLAQEEIKADGSTVVQIKYKRNRVSLILDLDGGSTTTTLKDGEDGKKLLEGKFEAKVEVKGLEKENFDFDVCFTSYLKRAIHTLNIILEEMDREYLPVLKAWQLNERHYGALQGLNKSETAEKYGEDQVKIWRRSFDIQPPALEADDERNPALQKQYRGEDKSVLPLAESLKDTIARVIPYYEEVILPEIIKGKRVLIAAHGNSLRALIMYLDKLSEKEIIEVNVPTGTPLVYTLSDDGKAQSKRYLGDQAEIEARMKAVAAQGKAK